MKINPNSIPIRVCHDHNSTTTTTTIMLILQILLCISFTTAIQAAATIDSTTTTTTISNRIQLPSHPDDEVHMSYDVPLPYGLTMEDLVVSYVNEISTTTNTNHHHHQQHDRQLEIGDFDRFNELFQNAQLVLPDAQVSESGLSLNIQNLICTNVYIGDIQSNYTTTIDSNSNTILAYTIMGYPISITCSADYTFEVLFVNGKGRFTAVTENSLVETRIDVQNTISNTFQNGPPNSVNVNYCQTNINTNGNIQFEGATLQRMLTLFKQVISNLVDKYAATAICDLLSDSGPELFQNVLNQTNTRIDNWLHPSLELLDPLHVEHTYTIPDGISFIDFQINPNTTNINTTTSISDVFVKFLQEADTLFGDTIIDPITGQSDLGINTFLRKTLLNTTTSTSSTAVWDIDISKFTEFNPILFTSHDKLTQSSIIINTIQIIGLDTLQTFNPFIVIGQYTIQNTLRWESLYMDIGLTVDIQPSTRSDSILQNPDPVRIVEEIIIRINFTNIDVDMSIFMPIDETKFENLSLGSILSTKTLLPCFFTTISALEISGLNVSMGDIGVPTLEGFVSPGIDRVLSQLADAAFVAYEPTLLRAIPGLFQTSIRDILKTRLIDSIADIGNNDKCPTITTIVPPNNNDIAIVDFRDLLLIPDDAITMGASGQQPYGNIGYFVYEFIQDSFTTPSNDDNTTLPKINQMLIEPFTKSQSGIPGLIQLLNTGMDLGSTATTNLTIPQQRLLQGNSILSVLGDDILFRVGDIRISNLNSIGYPLELLNLTSSPTTLANSIVMGSNGPINITIRIVAGVENMINEIDITASISSMSISADINALLDANKFLQFPMGDVLNYKCWLAALPAIQLTNTGFAKDVSSPRSLSLLGVDATLSSVSVSTECITCVSPGMKLLPEILQILERNGAIDIIGNRLPLLVESVSMSETTQTFFDRLISEAPKFCPSSPEYTINAVKNEYDPLGFPILNGESIDTLLYSGIVAVEVAAVVFAETQRLSNYTPSNALSTQNSFVPPNDIRLIDWTNIGNSTGLGGIADTIFDKVRDFLGGNTSNTFDFDKILGGLINDDGNLELETNFKLERGGIALTFDSIRVKGLNGFSLVDVLQPIGAQTLKLSAAFDALDIELTLTASVPNQSSPRQTISTQLLMRNVTAEIALFAAFDLDKIGSLELGALFTTKSIFQCILSTAHKLEIPQLKLSVGSFSNPIVKGLMSETGASATIVTDAIFNRFKPEILEAIPKVFDGVGKALLSSFLNVPDESSCSSAIRKSADGASIDFRDLLLPVTESVLLGGSGQSPYGTLISNIFTLIRNELFSADPETGLAFANVKLIDDFTETQSGTPGKLFFAGDILKSERNVQAGGLDAKFKLRVYDAYISNLDTVGAPLKLLEPVKEESNLLNNEAELGITRPLQLGVRLFFGLSNEDSDIENDLEISLDMRNLQLFLLGLGNVSEKSLMGFPIRDVTNMQCWLATIPPPELDSRGVRVDENMLSLSVLEFIAKVEDLGLNISCVKCSGPMIPELGALLTGLEGSNAVTDVANSIFELVSKLIEGNFLQLAIDRALNDANVRCPHSPNYDENISDFDYEAFDVAESENSTSFFAALLIVGAVLSAIVLTVVMTTKLIVRRRHRKWIASLPKRKLELLWMQQQHDVDRNAFLNESTVSLFRSDLIPQWVRWTMPFTILVNIGFFLSGHLSLAASVTIMASLGGQTFSEEGFFEFSVLKSTIETWNAGGQELAVLIFLFSFAWPYAKTLLTLSLWFVPPANLSVTMRGHILLWLDFLAKWSTIDIFVIIVTIVSFRVSVKSPDVAFLPSGFYSIDLLVAPKWGLYANLTAQIISQLSSHYIIHFHRRIVEKANENHSLFPNLVNTDTQLLDDEESENDTFSAKHISPQPALESNWGIKKEALCTHAFRRPHRGDSDKLVVRRAVGLLVLFLSASCVLLVILGCILPSYSVASLGIVGILVESGQKFLSAQNKYSVLTTITLLFDQASISGTAADYVGLGSLSFILILSVLVVPIAQSMVLLIQWFIPLTRKRRHRLMVFLEILQAWQYAEVYLLAILVGSWQLGPISEFMINPYCSSLKGFFSEMVYYGLLKEEDAQCFKSDVTVEPTFYLLFVGALLLAFINTFVMKAVSQYFRDGDSQHQVVSNDHDVSNMDISVDDGDQNLDLSDQLKIRPVPVLFTDRYRWLLQRQDAMPSASSSHECCDSERIRSIHDSCSSLNEKPSGMERTALYTSSVEDNVSLDDASLYTISKDAI